MTTVTALKLPKVYTDSMVLQAERVVIVGWTNATTVKVSIVDGKREADCPVTFNRTTTMFTAECGSQPPSKPSMPGATVIVQDSNNANATLSDVLFGSVFILSGQSNAAFAITTAFDGQDFIARANDPGMRLLTVQKNASTTPLDDVIDIEHPWRSAISENMCGGPSWMTKASFCEPHCGESSVVPSFKRPTWGYFSALGYLAGRAVRISRPDRAVGVIATSWGGTAIELWMPNDSALDCPEPNPTAEDEGESARHHRFKQRDGTGTGTAAGNSGLWNSMVNPLRFMPIEGILWMQGEANSGTVAKSLRYACELPKMISLWRELWTPRIAGQPAAAVFGVVQIAPFVTSASVAQLRWSQMAAAVLPNVTVASAIDLFDASSPCGSVHFRDKQPAAERIAATWRYTLAHNASLPPSDPIATAATAIGDGTVVVSITPNSADGISFASAPNQTTAPAWENFEVLVQPAGSGTQDAAWRCGQATILVNGTDGLASVQVEPSAALVAGETVVGVRYAWAPVPNGTFIMGAQFIGSTSDGRSRSFRRVASPFALFPATPGSTEWTPLNFTVAIPGGNTPAGCT